MKKIKNNKIKVKKYNKFFSYIYKDRKNRNFAYKDFSYSKSYKTNFTNSKFYGNNFLNAKMTYCGFNGCNFDFIEFKNVNFIGCKFTGAHFENILFDNCNLSNTSFKEATFKNIYYTNTSFKQLKEVSSSKNLSRINNQNIKISLSEELINAINKCKTNDFILSSHTLFYKRKNRLSNVQKKYEKTLSKTERKNLQRKRQEQLLKHPKPYLINKMNILRMLDIYSEVELAKGLHLAATEINNNFYSLSYFIPFIKKANE